MTYDIAIWLSEARKNNLRIQNHSEATAISYPHSVYSYMYTYTYIFTFVFVCTFTYVCEGGLVLKIEKLSNLHEKWNESQNRWQLSGWQRQVCNKIKLFKICTNSNNDSNKSMYVYTYVETTATAAVVQCSLLSVVVTVDSNNNNTNNNSKS